MTLCLLLLFSFSFHFSVQAQNGRKDKYFSSIERERRNTKKTQDSLKALKHDTVVYKNEVCLSILPRLGYVHYFNKKWGIEIFESIFPIQIEAYPYPFNGGLPPIPQMESGIGSRTVIGGRRRISSIISLSLGLAYKYFQSDPTRSVCETQNGPAYAYYTCTETTSSYIPYFGMNFNCWSKKNFACEFYFASGIGIVNYQAQVLSEDCSPDYQFAVYHPQTNTFSTPMIKSPPFNTSGTNAKAYLNFGFNLIWRTNPLTK